MTSLTSSVAAVHDTVLISPAVRLERWQNPGEGFRRISVPAADLARFVAELEVDIVSVHNIPGAAVHVEVPLSLAVHGVPNRESGWPGMVRGFPSPLDLEWDATSSMISTTATRLLAPSEFVAQAFSRDVADIDVVYPMVHPSFLTTPRLDDGSTVVWVGRLTKRKGLGFLATNGSRWSFPWTWSGEAYFSDLDQSTLERLPPPLPPARGVDQMRRLFATATVVLCPYLDEGFGMVAAEAAAAGCRVVGFDSGGLREIGARLPQVVLIDPMDVEGFDAAVVESLTAGPVDVAERAMAAEAFSPEVSGSAYLEHLARTVSRS